MSWSGLIAIAEQVGMGRIPAPWPILPAVLDGLAVLLWGRALARLPFRFAHGDLEWMASSPISRRAIALGALLPEQFKALLIGAVASTIFFGLSGGVHLYGTSLLTTMAILTLQTISFILCLARASRPGRPARWLWILPAVLIPLYAMWPGMRIPFHWAVAPFVGQPLWATAFYIAAVWGGAWIAAMLVAGRLNLITIQSRSSEYAGIRVLQQGVGRRLNQQLIREWRAENRLRGRRPWGRMPSWPMPVWEVGRLSLSVWRMPKQSLYLLEMAGLFRSSLFAVFLSSGYAWMFWLFAAYRLRLEVLARWYHRDVDVSFLRQFWPEDDMDRYVRSSILPGALVAVISFVVWALLPLRVPVTPLHLSYLVGIMVTWYLAESPALESRKAALGGHERAVLYTGLMIFIGAVLHDPLAALVVPLVVVVMAIVKVSRHRNISSDAHEPSLEVGHKDVS